MKILLVDDHALFRQGLKFLLSDLDDRLVFTEAGNLGDCLALAERGDSPELILLDYHMPGTDGLEALQRIRAAFDATIIVVSGEDDPATIRRIIDHGAAGFVSKSAQKDELIRALKLVLAGNVCVPRYALEAGLQGAEMHTNRSTVRDGFSIDVSERQREALLMALQGKSNKAIAREMSIAEGTVKAHLSVAFKALGVHNRTQALYVWADLGLDLPSGTPAARPQR